VKLIESTPVDTTNVIRLSIPAKPEYITLCRLALTGLARVRSFPDELVAEDDESDELTEGGLGIAIIRSIADELDIERRASGGSRLRFVKLLET
jgi:anti-sigma regulatory factor (Ser/Thr protein kinase)